MIPKFLFVSLLLAVSAQQYLATVPRACSVPKSPPTCMYSTATPYFRSCGIYSGGDCPRFCHSLQVQYWGRHRSRRCFVVTPSLLVLQHIYGHCMYRCSYAKRKIRQYRLARRQKIGSSATRPRRVLWNIKALVYLGANRRGSVTSQVLVYTSGALNNCAKNKDGTLNCPRVSGKPLNRCICSSCWRYRASCPRCCRNSGHIWV